jgi:hypothetical protein
MKPLQACVIFQYSAHSISVDISSNSNFMEVYTSANTELYIALHTNTPLYFGDWDSLLGIVMIDV